MSGSVLSDVCGCRSLFFYVEQITLFTPFVIVFTLFYFVCDALPETYDDVPSFTYLLIVTSSDIAAIVVRLDASSSYQAWGCV